MLQLTIIAVYFAGMIVIGVISRRKLRGANDFFVAGRKGSSLFITGSLLATIIGGSATIGMAGLGFTRGLTGAWWLLVGSIGLVVLGIFFAKKVREFGLYTLPELVEKQYDKRVALAASVLIVVAWIGIIAGQIIAAGKIMSALGIWDTQLWMVIFTGVFVIYTIVGGQYAIIRTDTLQTVIIFIGIFSALGLLLYQLGGLHQLYSSLSSDRFSFPISSDFSGYDLTSLILLVGLTYVVGPDMYSRLFCARDVKVARASVFWTALLIIPFAFGITMIGMGASALFPEVLSEQAFPTVIKEVLPPFMGGIVLAALLCAVMSSADTCLLSSATILAVDIVKPFKPSLSQQQIINLSRWVIVVLGLGSLMLALYLGKIIDSLLFAYTVYTSGLIIPVIAGFYRNRLKITSSGALAAVIGGGVVALIIKLLGRNPELGIPRWFELLGLLVSITLLFIVSFISHRVKSKTALDSEQGMK